MSEDDRIAKLEKELREIKLRLNHITHPPHINAVLDYIRKHKVATMPQLKQQFPTLYGGNLSRLYKALREKHEEFVYVEGSGKKAKMVVAHLNEGKPESPEAMAVQLFERTRKGGLLSLERVKKRYRLSEQDARKVYDFIIELFKPRISYGQLPTDRYRIPIKRLY